MATETVKLEDGPKTEAASIAAQTAVLAAEKAVENATEIAATAQRAAAAETARLTEETAKALGANKDDMEWLKEHTRLSSARHEETSKELTTLKSQALEVKASLAEMISDFRSTMMSRSGLAPPLPEMDNLPLAELPIQPPEGEDPKAPKTDARKRRLI